MNYNIKELERFYLSFYYLYHKVKNGSKLNYYDRCFLEIFEEYNYFLDFAYEWRRRPYD